MPDNGDQNPYAIVVAPVSVGKIQRDDVLIDNFNNLSNLQGLGTTIVDYNPATRKTTLFTSVPQEFAAMPGWYRVDDGDDDAEKRMGDRRQYAEQ